MLRHGYGYRWGGYCGCPYVGAAWAWPVGREEFIEDLEDYKAMLESDIAALERRIKALKEKAELERKS